MKRIAVLMSTYNGEKYLRTQIDSILDQICEYHIDLIVRDDGSSDNTVNILQDYYNEGKIQLSLERNIGPGFGFLKMIIDNPGYDFYAFSDQDDYWEKDKIQKAIDKINGIENYALYFSNAEMVDSNLKPIGRNVHRNMSHFNLKRVLLGFSCAQGCTCVFNSKLALEIQRYPLPESIVLHDSYLTCLCFVLGGHYYADEASYIKYRMHGNNVGGLQTRTQSSMIGIIKKRIKYIFVSNDKSVIDQDALLYKRYEGFIRPDVTDVYKDVLKLKKSLFIRLKYVIDSELKDESFNLSLANRVKLMLNNL